MLDNAGRCPSASGMIAVEIAEDLRIFQFTEPFLSLSKGGPFHYGTRIAASEIGWGG
ncbi:MAG: hypothetical protein ACKO4T_04350 [Planctomycetaceae bacterium]